MRAFARFRLTDGSVVELGHGDLIGRLHTAALSLPDARISEAHAMLSLRGQELKLLALRGRFALGGRTRSSLVLEAGQVIELADGLSLIVEAVELPAAVMGLEGDGLPGQVLIGVSSLLTRPRAELVPRFVPGAAAHLWNDGDGWMLQLGDEISPLRPGQAWTVDGRTFRAVAVALASAGHAATRAEGSLQRSLRIVAHFETAHIHVDGGVALALSGLSARILSELVAFDGPVPWEVLAKELWPDEDDRHLLRRKLDVSLSRLRRKLRQSGVRSDLVKADGFGHFELFLLTEDTVEDRT